MTKDIKQQIVEALTSFHWWNYGLDEVSYGTISDEWAQGLADKLLAEFPQLLAKDPVDGH